MNTASQNSYVTLFNSNKRRQTARTFLFVCFSHSMYNDCVRSNLCGAS